jgi:outer membrane protein OmpA-like peptidoglycan-associated protein
LNLSNFEAILRFDYNSSQLSEENKELIKQLAAKLPEGATIQILGSTDELGTQQRNSILAKERAENTRNLILSVAKDKFKIEIGTNPDKFREESPQGRFLNRSIRIKVKK